MLRVCLVFAFSFVVSALAGCASVGQRAAAVAPSPPIPAWSIAIHGGAGVIERDSITPEQDAAYRASLSAAIAKGADMLEQGRSALDVVEATAQILEDDPLFNAGRGAVFSAEGRNELDASIMDGRTRAAGAVAGVTRTRHPISLARAVMQRSDHVFLTGPGADAFSRAQGLEQVEPSYFFTEPRWRALERNLQQRGLPIPPRPAGAPAPAPEAKASLIDDHKFGTIGVVVRDRAGDWAAGTSTGGLTGKRWGRIGDAPVLGAGTYAENGVCAVSATGTGEYFIRLSVARTICARISMKGETTQAAADAVIKDLSAIEGDGGVIVIGPRGEPAFSLNTPGMYRARQVAGGAPQVSIFADE